MSHWALLAVAIIAEVIATTALKSSNGLTRWGPGVVVVAGYATAFYFLAQSLRWVPVGTAYAIWSGAGIALIAILGWVVHRQSLDLPAVAGIGLIVAGVAIISLFSRATA